jgi:hypothetical protein
MQVESVVQKPDNHRDKLGGVGTYATLLSCFLLWYDTRRITRVLLSIDFNDTSVPFDRNRTDDETVRKLW